MTKTQTAQVSDDFDSAPTRLYSLDALRGFDMFWIMGAEEIFHGMADAMHGKSAFWNALARQLTHPRLERFSRLRPDLPAFPFYGRCFNAIFGWQRVG